MESKVVSFRDVIRYYPQRVILLVNALVAAVAYFIDISSTTMAVLWPIVNAILVFFYGEPRTNSKAWVEENFVPKDVESAQ